MNTHIHTTDSENVLKVSEVDRLTTINQAQSDNLKLAMERITALQNALNRAEGAIAKVGELAQRVAELEELRDEAEQAELDEAFIENRDVMPVGITAEGIGARRREVELLTLDQEIGIGWRKGEPHKEDVELAGYLNDGWAILDLTVVGSYSDKQSAVMSNRVVTLQRVKGLPVAPEPSPEKEATLEVQEVPVVIEPEKVQEEPLSEPDKEEEPLPVLVGVIGTTLPDHLVEMPDGVTIDTPYAEAIKHPKVRSQHLRVIAQRQADGIDEKHGMYTCIEDAPEHITYSDALKMRGIPRDVVAAIGNREIYNKVYPAYQARKQAIEEAAKNRRPLGSREPA